MQSEASRILPKGGWDDIARTFRWTVPDDFTIHDRCNTRWANADPDRTAIVDLSGDGKRRVWTHGELKSASDRLATALRDWGVGKGDRVGVLLPQSAEVIVAHFAAMKVGAIVVPLFVLFGEEALSFRLRDSGAKVVVTDDDGVGKLSELKAGLPDLVRVVTAGEAKNAERLADVISAFQPLIEPVPLRADDPAVLIYTSGTTGPPKGALHAHRYLIGHLPCVELTLEGFPATGDVCWTPADWAWIGALMDLAMPCLYYGLPLVAFRFEKFDPERAWELIVDEGVSASFLPPTALKLMRQVEVPKAHRLRAINSGGESLATDLIDWASGEVGATLNELYGQTECNLVVASCEGKGVWRAAKIGRAVPGHRVAVINSSGKEVPAGEVGEIAVMRPDPVMFLGYWNQPEKTAEKFVGDWMKTGDLGQMDEDGYLAFVSRDDDVITSAGYRIGPTEIENCLIGDPDVVMAAVIGVPDIERTEIVKAFVVLRDGASTDGIEAGLIARVRERVSPHMAPRVVEVVDELPMTVTGKIMRRALRDAEQLKGAD